MYHKERDFCLYTLGKLSDYLATENLIDYFYEIDGRSQVILELEKGVADESHFKTKHFDSVFDFKLFRIVLYVLTRTFRPRVFVETGVLHGLTTHFLLHAISRNGKGKLVSIDWPSYAETGPRNQDGHYAVLPPGREPGWVIPACYRDHWDLLLGSSHDQLPQVFETYPTIDLFLHDSDHTYPTMWRELEMAWPHLASGGVIVCDNINDTTAFFDFCRKVDRHPFVLAYGSDDVFHKIRCGIVKK